MKPKTIICTMTFLAGLVIVPSPRSATIHHVTTPAQFQTALDAAANNRDTDFILVAPGDYELTEGLVYDPNEHEDYGLFIGGYTRTRPRLHGRVPMILLHIQYGCDVDWHSTRAQVLVSDMIFSDTVSDEGPAGLVVKRKDERITVSNCLFQGLSGGGDDESAGGMLLTTNLGPMYLVQNVFAHNHGDHVGGGALQTWGGNLYVHNNTFFANTGNLTGGFLIAWQSQSDEFGDSRSFIFNNIMWGNSSDEEEHRDFYYYLYVLGEDDPYILVASNDIGSGLRYIKWIEAVHGDYYDPVEVRDTIHENPVFAPPGLSLDVTSPCIDTGINPMPAGYHFPPFDFGWNPRLTDGDFDGIAQYDMGAMEYRLVLEPRMLDIRFIPINPVDKLETDGPLILLPLEQNSVCSHQNVRWNVSLHRSPGNTRFSIHYGNDDETSYQTGKDQNYGVLFVPDISLKNFQHPVLRFMCYMDTEPGASYDRFTVSVNGTDVWQKSDQTLPLKTWKEISVDLKQYAGSRIEILFDFDTVDGMFNNGAGLYLDSLRIEEYSPQTTYNAAPNNKQNNQPVKPSSIIRNDKAIEMTVPF